ncbi:MAG: hypothetical protein K1Y02_05420 [Candidatus Hydrogenedentes bacterium]|nr:hypothetical protein [Candidatus Hydrogenedentota bacterium]
MTLLGILLAIAGVLGVVGVFMGIIQSTGLIGDPRLWGGVAAAGIILAIFTRRPRD